MIALEAQEQSYDLTRGYAPGKATSTIRPGA
jgi:hypothetical protein